MEAFLYSRVFGGPAPNPVPETSKSHTERQLIQRRLQYLSMVRLRKNQAIPGTELHGRHLVFPEKASRPVKVGKHYGY